MARRETRVTVQAREGEAPGRDEGKTFLLREMPASQVEDWCLRALLALAKAGVELPDGIESAGAAGIAAMGVQALQGLNYTEAKPLMDEMMGCVQICPDPRNPTVIRPLVEDDIEELKTRLFLRNQIIELHVGFSRPGVHSASAAPETPFPASGVITRTSPAPSGW